MTTRVIKLPLKRAIKRYLSAEDYDAYLSEAMNLLDLLYTYFFRYPWLLRDIEGAMGSHGAAMDFIASNPIAATGLIMILGAAAATTVIQEYSNRSKAAKKQAGDYQASHKLINKRLCERVAGPKALALLIDDPLKPVLSLPDSKLAFHEKTADQQLEELRRTDKNLDKKYRKIRVNKKGLLVMTFREEGEIGDYEYAAGEEKPVEEVNEKPSLWQRIKNIIHLSWETLGICSFAYWLLWIGAGVLTGNFAAVGIEALGLAAFIIPLAIGALSPLIKIYNWWKNNYGQKIEKQEDELVQIEEDPRLVMPAAADASKLLRKVIFQDEKSRLQSELKKLGVSGELINKLDVDESYLHGDEQIVTMGQGKWEKTAIAFVTIALGTFVCAQYNAWIVTDILKAATGLALDSVGLNLICGTVFIVLSAAYGAYKAYQRYQEVQKNKAAIEKQDIKLNTLVSNLENIYNNKKARISALLMELTVLAKNSEDDRNWLYLQTSQIASSTLIAPLSEQKVEVKGFWAKLWKFCLRAYVFFCGSTTGIMIARVGTIAGSAIFLPFAAAALSNPLTIGVLVAAGIVYGLLKAYQYHQAKKEAHAKELFEQRAEKIETLKGQGEVADLQIRLLLAKKKELEARVGPKEEKVENPVAELSPRVGNDAVFPKARVYTVADHVSLFLRAREEPAAGREAAYYQLPQVG